MLRNHGRALSQWNIDNTIGSISVICSQKGPSLRPNRAGTVYHHLCALIKTILLSHRLRLQGRFHLVVQVMQALLHCLFTPLPHTSIKSLKHISTPPWLPYTFPSPLKAAHAAAYARLVTLICDPTVSSVSRGSLNNLTSSTDKAKHVAGQHMKFILTSYIKLQLEMRMKPEMRQELVPALYAIFDTTSVEGRKGVSDGLDASGRSVFGTLWREYVKFGKWKGA